MISIKEYANSTQRRRTPPNQEKAEPEEEKKTDEKVQDGRKITFPIELNEEPRPQAKKRKSSGEDISGHRFNQLMRTSNLTQEEKKIKIQIVQRR